MNKKTLRQTGQFFTIYTLLWIWIIISVFVNKSNQIDFLITETAKGLISVDSCCAENDILRNQIVKLQSALHIFTNANPVITTAYNAHRNQTDDSPLITASGDSVSEGSIALSRDLLRVYGRGGSLSWGDTVYVIMPFKVTDSMNGRYNNSADIFMHNYANAIAFGRNKGLIYYN